jgi:mannose-1-phosphate guanylyltransferase
MKAVVLIGGKGTRLRPITHTVPKSMVPLRNRPYFCYMLDSLKAAGLDGAVLSMGYLPEAIRDYFGRGEESEGFSLEYVVEDRPLGTAGGIKNVEAHLEGGPFVATNGDILTDLDLSELVEAHQESDALATITLTSVENPTAYGLVEVDSQMQVRRFLEKPAYDEVTTSLVNAGIYVLEPEVLNLIPEGREESLEREVFPRLQSMGKLRAHVSSAYWRDIGTPKCYLAASHDVLSGAIGRNGDFRYASLHDSTRISKNVTLLPPLHVAGDCEVGAGATIGGRTSLGERCIVGEGAVIEGSILFDDAKVEGGAVVRNSIVGPGAVIRRDCIVRGASVLGAGCVVEEGNVLDQGARIAPGVHVPTRVISF